MNIPSRNLLTSWNYIPCKIQSICNSSLLYSITLTKHAYLRNTKFPLIKAASLSSSWFILHQFYIITMCLRLTKNYMNHKTWNAPTTLWNQNVTNNERIHSIQVYQVCYLQSAKFKNTINWIGWPIKGIVFYVSRFFTFLHKNLLILHIFGQFFTLKITFKICDTIKGNESHVGNIQFWFFNINHLSILNATFWSKPHLNQTSGCRDMNNSLNSKTM